MVSGGSSRRLAITLPSSLVPTGGTPNLVLSILDDRQITGNKRAITRTYEDANSTNGSRRKRVEWEIWGPIGASLESAAGFLGTDFVRNLETRWERRLTSSGAQTTVTLTGDDPPGTEPAYFGDFTFGDVDYPFGSPIAGGDVIVFAEQDGYLFAYRERLSTQVDLADWTVTDTQVLAANVRDADHWRGHVYVALGPSSPMLRLVGASPTGAIYQSVTATSPSMTVYANAIKRGSDRAWYIDADRIGSSYPDGNAFNFAGFTLDGFVNLASPFQVGDPEVGTTGIGPFGPFTMFGSQDNFYSFTDQGKPTPVSRALDSLHSPLNGQQWADPGWRWNYALSIMGLRGVQPGVDNPIGIGERMRDFTGHNGIPTAIWSTRGELFVVYQTTSGDLYGYRCAFGPETGGTGQPLIFPWFYAANQTCKALFSTTTPATTEQNIVVIRASDTNLTYMQVASNGLDNLDPSYVYSVYGLGASWQLALAPDPNPVNTVASTYVNIGAAITTSGASTLTPVSGTTPTSNISGRSFKPRIRLTDALGGTYDWYGTTLDRDPNLLKTWRLFRVRARNMGEAALPPELLGALEGEYDERPDTVERFDIVVNVTGSGYTDNYIWQVLNDLANETTDGPFAVQIPDDLPPGVSGSSGGGQKYAMVGPVTARHDVNDQSIEALQVTLYTWPRSEALSS